MPEIEKCPCAGCRDKREVRLRTELASQAAKVEAVRGAVEECKRRHLGYRAFFQRVLAVLKS